MTPAKTISAWENLQSDFFWVPNFLVWVGELVADLSPLIALLGAIHLYYKKEAASRYSESRSERVTLYRSFLAQIEKCTAVYQRPKNQNWHLHDEVRKLWALQAEIELVGSHSAVEASAQVVTAINDLFMSEDGFVISLDGNARSTWDNVAFMEKDAIGKFKKDLER